MTYNVDYVIIMGMFDCSCPNMSTTGQGVTCSKDKIDLLQVLENSVDQNHHVA